ncbi:MAG: translation elongation factor 4 [Patescibacteria group bacterium]
MNQEQIRNFCITAHIDHGKSTLADRFLELTGAVSQREFRNQFLDQMELERERGITIKMQPVRMTYRPQILSSKHEILNKSKTQNSKGLEIRNSDLEIANSTQEFVLNLIDTPGHVDFTYEVSRSLAAVEGAILLVDITQGIQAQTLANLHLAQKQNLAIVGAVNKIDLNHSKADLEALKSKIAELINCSPEEILEVSGKTGQGAAELLRLVILKIPPPQGKPEALLRALVFDSFYDSFKGVVACIRLVDGEVKQGDRIKLFASGAETEILELGIFKPKLTPVGSLSAGEIGYIATGIKDPSLVRVGDTVVKIPNSQFSISNIIPLPGYQEPQSLVFVNFYPEDTNRFELLENALKKLKLNDAALFFAKEKQEVLGQGFRLGFLGSLHLEIVKERLRREYQLNPIITIPTVKHQVILKAGEEIEIFSPNDLPSADKISEIKEPWVKGEIIVANIYLSQVLSLVQLNRGWAGGLENMSNEIVLVNFHLPLAEIILDFYDKLKSASRGYASLSYEVSGWQAGDLVKLDILIANEKVDAFARIVPREKADSIGRQTIEKIKELLPREAFAVAIQAAIGSKIIARVTLSAMKKDVTGHLYGGDRTRKMKLWEKQQKGKKRLAKFGKVQVPNEVFFEVFKATK